MYIYDVKITLSHNLKLVFIKGVNSELENSAYIDTHNICIEKPTDRQSKFQPLFLKTLTHENVI